MKHLSRVDSLRVAYENPPPSQGGGLPFPARYAGMIQRILFAAIFMTGSGWAQAQDAYRVAVFDEPGFPVASGATPAQTFADALALEGYTVTRLDARQAADTNLLNAAHFDLLAVPTGAVFPLEARDAVLAFVQQGGDLFCTGGYAFDLLVRHEDGGWVTQDAWRSGAFARARQPETARIVNGGFEEDSAGWQGTGTAASVVREGAYAGQACGRVSLPGPGGGSWETPLPVQPGQSYLVGAQMRTRNLQGAGYAFLAVYQYDAQGGLVQFVDFEQRKSESGWRRAEALITIAPTTARTVFRAGLYLTGGEVWVDEVTCSPAPEELRMNAHYGKPEDGLIIEPYQLPLFSPDQRFSGVRVESMPGTALLPGWRLDVPVDGFEATAQLQQSGQWTPLLHAVDEQGTDAGTPLALAVFSKGVFAHSMWALCGVENRNLFVGEAGLRLVRETIGVLRAGVGIDTISADQAIYHPGETAQIAATVSNHSRTPRTLELAWSGDFAPPAMTFVLEPLQTQTQRVAWGVPAGAPPYVAHRAVLRHQGSVVAERAAGFCVYHPEVVAQAPSLRFANNTFWLRDTSGHERTACLFGTDTFGNMFFSPSLPPETWRKDTETMRVCGLDLFENLHYIPKGYTFEDKDWRKFDALIQLGQAQGLPYMAGMLVGANVAVDNAELARQAALCGQYAARYKNTPGFIYYLNGDLRLDIQDLPDLRRLWNDFLQERYGSDEALRAAWTLRAPEAPLGQVPLVEYTAQSWYDVRARDWTAFKVRLTRRWLDALSQAVRAEDATHAITAEYYQRPFAGIDLRLTSEVIDVANFGYFDTYPADMGRLQATMKWNDMRLSGHGLNVGEFGAKTHDAWQRQRGASGYHAQRTEAQQAELYWWMAHCAWAMGASKIQNWCWSDDPDRVFPWGLAWNNPLRLKPWAKQWLSLRAFAGQMQLEPVYTPAQTVFVFPDSWRLGANEVFEHQAILNALECLLATNIPFDTANEAHLPLLRERVPKLVVMPFAYALSDETLETLRGLAEAGSLLYLSGDPSIDPAGLRRPERLERYFGARFLKEEVAASGLPYPRVAAAGADILPGPHYRLHLGKGTVVWSPEPWEAFAGADLFAEHPEMTANPGLNRYQGLVKAVGLEPAVRVESSRGPWRVVDTPAGAHRLITLLPRFGNAQTGPVNVRGRLGTLAFEFRMPKPLPACLVLDAQGRMMGATGCGALLVDGRTVHTNAEPWTYCARAGDTP